MSERIDLTALAADPVRVKDVPVDTIPALLYQLNTVQAALAARLADSPPRSDAEPAHANDDQLMTAAQAAAMLEVPEGYVGHLGRSGKLARVPFGKYVRFRLGDLRAWIARHRQSEVDAAMCVTYRSARDERRGAPASETAPALADGARRPRRRDRKQRGTLGAGRAGNP